MKMLGFEKLMGNSPWSKKKVVELAKKLLEMAELRDATDFLEIGCGNGEVSKYIARNYVGKVIATDIDPDQIAIARKGSGNISNLRFQVADAVELPFEDESFDVVIAFGVLHHIDKWDTAMAEIIRVLRPGGYLIYAEVIYPEAISSMDKSSSLSFGLETVDIEKVKAFFEKNGFTQVYSFLEKVLVCHNYEAVYRKG
jgi:ubiquinone/menaquinone biosynthesis C-methylase UbiE